MSSEQSTCRSFSLDEIRAATNDFDESLVIGRGGFGKIFKGQISNEDVAIKRLFYTPNRDIEFKKEIETVSYIRHCRLISLIGYCHEKDELILVYEYMPNGSLDKHLHKDGKASPLSWEVRLKICIGAVDGLHYLHQGIGLDKRIIHGDIKSSNILLDKNFEAKISDFGLSTVAPANTGCSYVEHTTLKFSPGYVDPHYRETGKLTKESDVYSFGILLLEVLCGKKALDQSVRDKLKQGKYDDIIDPNLEMEISEECLHDFISISLKCLHNVRHRRPRMAEVIAALYKLDASLAPMKGLQDSFAIRMEFLEDNGRGYDIRETTRLSGSRPIISDGKVKKGKTFMQRVNDFLFRGHRGSVQPKDSQTTSVTASHFLGKVSSTDPDNMQQGPSSLDNAVNNNHPIRNLLFLRDDIKTFDLEDLLRASAEVVGKGMLGSTYKCKLERGDMMVVKRFKDIIVGQQEFREHMRRLGRLKHSNLLSLVAFYSSLEEKLLISDYVQNDSLAAHLHGTRGHGRTSLDWPTRLKIVKGIARGLLYLYDELPSFTAPHGDLKSKNVLLNESWEPLLSDYGLNSMFNMYAEEWNLYQPPEYKHNLRMTKKTDVWSLGVLILEIVTGKSIHEGHLVTWVKSTVREHWVAELFDTEILRYANLEEQVTKLFEIGLSCCEVDVDKRWDMKEAVERIENVREKDDDEEEFSQN